MKTIQVKWNNPRSFKPAIRKAKKEATYLWYETVRKRGLWISAADSNTCEGYLRVERAFAPSLDDQFKFHASMRG